MSNKKEEKTRVLITGANGQLGRCIKSIEETFLNVEFRFVTKTELDITKKDLVKSFFNNVSFDVIINCAAYTDVEQAEKQSEKAFLINAEGVKNIAEICKEYNITLIHISTDYVFDGKKKTPYLENDIPNPLNVYGRSKLLGEQYIQQILDKYFIIRTSWLYSQYGKNFYKTILEKSEKEEPLNITASEIGTPTNANDLAIFILSLIENDSKEHGVYHFSNQGKATWYDFAEEILKTLNKLEFVKLKKTNNYHTFAKRPIYSVLGNRKVHKTFGVDILSWEKSLKILTRK